jgi:hypothetical protein
MRQGPGRVATRQVVRMLRQADRDLERRLRREARLHGGPSARFTGASLQSYRHQVRLVTAYTEARMSGITHDAAMATVRASYGSSVRHMAALEEAFTGVSRPLMLDEVTGLARAERTVSGALLRRIPTSMDRYGAIIARQVEEVLQAGLLRGASQSEMIDELQRLGGPRGPNVSLRARVVGGRVVRTQVANIPEGLFSRHRYWAARLVRTEIAFAQNASSMEVMHQQEEHLPGGQKKILAMMDNRVAPDSLAVHGQVRGLREEFVDGAGRRYQHPPARPNDREVVIPWRPEWPNTPSTRPEPTDIRSALAASATGQLTPAQEEAVLARARAIRAERDAAGARIASRTGGR